jgi:hypothetical protein
MTYGMLCFSAVGAAFGGLEFFTIKQIFSSLMAQNLRFGLRSLRKLVARR